MPIAVLYFGKGDVMTKQERKEFRDLLARFNDLLYECEQLAELIQKGMLDDEKEFDLLKKETELKNIEMFIADNYLCL